MSKSNPRQTYSTYKKQCNNFLHIHPESRTQNGRPWTGDLWGIPLIRKGLALSGQITKMLHEKMDFMCYLAVPQPNLGRFRGDRLTNPMLITAFFILIWKGWSHSEPRNETESLNLPKHPKGYEPISFWFDCYTLTCRANLSKLTFFIIFA